MGTGGSDETTRSSETARGAGKAARRAETTARAAETRGGSKTATRTAAETAARARANSTTSARIKQMKALSIFQSSVYKSWVLGSRILDIIQEKSGHLWNINIRMIKLSEMCNNLE